MSNSKRVQTSGRILFAEPHTKLKMELVSDDEAVAQILHYQRLEAVGTMTAGVAHDFNNLLTAISGNLQLAQRKIKEGRPIADQLEEIEKASNKAVVLTRQLLTFSRHQHIECQPVNINFAVAESLNLIKRLIGDKITISVNYDDSLAPVIANSLQIEQILINLLLNARDAMPAGGSITIETKSVKLDELFCGKHRKIKSGAFACIKISDTGTGMDKETLKRIFEPFYTTKEIGKGTGLGLSMARGIIEQYCGRINVESHPGAGTTFDILIPVDTNDFRPSTD